MLEERVWQPLSELADWLGGREWLEDGFTAGDLMMVTILRRMLGSTVLEEYPEISAYIARGEARPGFGRAFAAQKAAFEAVSGTAD